MWSKIAPPRVGSANVRRRTYLVKTQVGSPNGRTYLGFFTKQVRKKSVVHSGRFGEGSSTNLLDERWFVRSSIRRTYVAFCHVGSPNLLGKMPSRFAERTNGRTIVRQVGSSTNLRRTYPNGPHFFSGPVE